MMSEIAYEVGDRRPIAARRLAVMNRFALRVAALGVGANTISIAGMTCGILAGASLGFTNVPGPTGQRVCWLVAAALIQLRLLANLLDGMVAIASGTASRMGEIFNDAPDRVSDAATLIGLGYSLGGSPALGWSAAILAMGTAYVRLLGKASGVASDFRGPMAKQHRMFLVTIGCLICGFAPVQFRHYTTISCLGLICVGCVLTIVRRLSGIASGLRMNK
jgi:phosphatidylglycerophosphate synthase